MMLVELVDLLRFVEIEDEKLKKRYSSLSSQEMILARTVKLAEEFGELCEEVLTYSALQRRQKLDNRNEENLPEEFADVIITALLLAKSMNVNVETALETKMHRLNQRE
jgi:NTP pyrophosphatase (non-canonical NTP hydrolase)